MGKVTLGAKTLLYPMTMTIIGANINNRPNYLAAGWCTIIEHAPAMFLFSTTRTRYTVQGILENQTFSVNIPTSKMAKLTDYVGIYSGRNVDKSHLFTNFYGKLATAPMIEECPVNMECKLVQTVKFGTEHELFLGEIIETYANENCLTNNLPDAKKIDPLLITPKDNHYWTINDIVGKAWSIGKEL
jgi:flavin reductase (DIM6/NTAB) family NADH-FMN oxidoreductase RutF